VNEVLKPYICFKYPFCEERFDTAEERDEHMRVVHPQPERKPVERKIRKWNQSRIPDNAEDTETVEDRDKEGPYPLPLDMIAMRCDSKGKSLRPKIRDEVWEFWDEPYWKTVVKYYEEINQSRDKLKNWIERYRITKIVIKLAKKIFEQTGLKIFPIVSKVRASSADKSAGAWSWSMNGVIPSDNPKHSDSMFDVGSSWPMKNLLLKDVMLEKYHFHFWEINPTGDTMKHIKSRFDR